MQKYLIKQTKLQQAQKRVENILSDLKARQQAHPLYYRWNEVHELSDRLTDRLLQNWKNYKEWHWDTYEFNTY